MKIKEVMSITEAALKWGVSRNSVKFSCTGQKGRPPRLKDNECRYSGGVWLVTYDGMVRLFGEPVEGGNKDECNKS